MRNRLLSWDKWIAGALFLSACLAITAPAEAAYKIGDDERYLKIGGLLQAYTTYMEDDNVTMDAWAADMYLRRMRLMVYGQAHPKVNFFIETDSPNFGKDGNYSVDMFVQDAYFELNLKKTLQFDFGMLLVPFSHHGMQGATSLLGLDYHASMIRYPTGSNKVWRDYGMMVRGIFSSGIEYRLGMFRGAHGTLGSTEYGDEEERWYEPSDPRNQDKTPRFAGRLTFNIFDPEGGPGVGGMFYDGLYIKKTDNGIVSSKKVLAFGCSLDWQADQNVTYGDIPADGGLREIDKQDDYVAAAVDVFWDIPLGDDKTRSFNGQVNFYSYDYGDRRGGDSYWDSINSSRAYTGYGFLTEIGYRINAHQPVILFDWYDSTKAPGDMGDYIGVYGGYNYWWLGHSTCFKFQFGGSKFDGADDYALGAIFQAQLVF